MHKKRCLNVCKVRENTPPFAASADDATKRAQRQNVYNIVRKMAPHSKHLEIAVFLYE